MVLYFFIYNSMANMWAWKLGETSDLSQLNLNTVAQMVS